MITRNGVLLQHHYPQSVGAGAVINYTLPEEDQINLAIYNFAGDLVSSLIDERQKQGSYSVFFDAENIPAGKYLYILRAGARYHSNVLAIE